MWVMMCESETERALERAAERLLRCRWALSPRTLCVYRAGGGTTRCSPITHSAPVARVSHTSAPTTPRISPMSRRPWRENARRVSTRRGWAA